MKEQNVEYFNFRDTLDKKMKKSNWIQILEVNGQQIPKSPDDVCFVNVRSNLNLNFLDLCYTIMQLLDACADIIMFGKLDPCPTCNGQLTFDKAGYTCTGQISEWVKCDFSVKEPSRQVAKIPQGLQKYFPSYHGTTVVRAVKNIVAPTISVRREYAADQVLL